MTELSTFAQLDAVRARLAALPRVAERVAERAAARLTELATATFDARENVAGEAWADGADGKPVTLNKSGRLRRDAVRYVAVGTRIRATVAATPYARFQLKRGFLPRTIPAAWGSEIARIADEELAAHLARVA